MRGRLAAAARWSGNASVPLHRLSENFIDGTSANYVEQMHESWLNDKSSVHASWAAYFANVEGGAAPGDAFAAAPAPGTAAPSFSPSTSPSQAHVATKLVQLIRGFQVFGHNAATLDPLGLRPPMLVKELDPATYGLTEAELDTVVQKIDFSNQFQGYLSEDSSRTVRDLIVCLKEAYCGNIGVEFMHIADREKANWIRARFESRQRKFANSDREVNFTRLVEGTKFEHFLGMKYNDKRFGCDGAEVIIPGLKTLVDTSASLGVKDITIGMAHRGRLNVLANVLKKPLEDIFHEFRAGTMSKEDIASGDVKYHLGTSHDYVTNAGENIHLSLMANPSHLEAVNPLVEGKTKSKLVARGDTKGTTACSVLIHGDASYAGQGIVYETITMSGLPKYTTGGTIHVVLNNQIGFTTDPEDSRPGRYCTDVSKTTKSPIFHVNGDDTDAVCWTMKLAAEWRQTFHTDVVVDIIAYRRFGHNEVDQPAFTQPLMYQHIKKHPQTLDVYAKQLISEGVLTKEKVDQTVAATIKGFEDGFARSKDHVPKESEWLDSKWKGFKSPEQLARIKSTGVDVDILRRLGKAISTVPEKFSPHTVIKKILKTRMDTFNKDEDIDWATAEQLAFSTLLSEGTGVRLSGQDVERGTFSHRHAVIHDQKTGEEYSILNNLPAELQKAKFQIANSFLSEYAAMGFELGYAISDPNTLVMWEAQFGDFVNGAQIILDQFLACGEQKWMRQSGLVLLLPHGYEGMGPEHSSARIERFLQNCDQDVDVIPKNYDEEAFEQSVNWQVVNCSTPANYFHVLRRQQHREFRKPLVIFTPKSLLRHPLVKSPLSAFDNVAEDGDDCVMRTYSETSKDIVSPEKVKRVVFCSGKVYWDLYEEREKLGKKDIALLRIEQLCPFPYDLVQKELEKYTNAEFVWGQEEPKNMGAWTFMFFNFRTTFKSLNLNKELTYIGRKTSASPAAGSAYTHKKELAQLLSEVFTY